jgi:hypothetical protein
VLIAGSTPSPAPPFARLINQFHVTLYLLPGSGTITIIAYDPVSGLSPLLGTFTFDPPP